MLALVYAMRKQANLATWLGSDSVGPKSERNYLIPKHGDMQRSRNPYAAIVGIDRRLYLIANIKPRP